MIHVPYFIKNEFPIFRDANNSLSKGEEFNLVNTSSIGKIMTSIYHISSSFSYENVLEFVI